MKPSIKFITDFYFRKNYEYMQMAFAKHQDFDPAYLQEKCDRVYDEIQFSVGKTKEYFSNSDKERLARKVKSVY